MPHSSYTDNTQYCLFQRPESHGCSCDFLTLHHISNKVALIYDSVTYSMLCTVVLFKQECFSSRVMEMCTMSTLLFEYFFDDSHVHYLQSHALPWTCLKCSKRHGSAPTTASLDTTYMCITNSVAPCQAPRWSKILLKKECLALFVQYRTPSQAINLTSPYVLCANLMLCGLL